MTPEQNKIEITTGRKIYLEDEMRLHLKNHKFFNRVWRRLFSRPCLCYYCRFNIPAFEPDKAEVKR